MAPHFNWTEVTGGENGRSFRRPPLPIPGVFSTPIVGAAFFLVLREAFSHFFHSGGTDMLGGACLFLALVRR